MQASPTTEGRRRPTGRHRMTIVAILVVAVVAVTGVAAASIGDSDRVGQASVPVGASVGLTADGGVDVAEDGTRFVFDQNGPLLPNEFPAYGNGFVTQGYLYPKGTLGEDDGVLADGSPQYPDLVIGTWTCWGYFIGDGADTTDGPWVVTTQLFDFGPDDGGVGGNTLVTVGTETPAGAGPIDRSVTGGTGRFSLTRGQMTQETLGHNGSDGVNASFDFDLAGVTGDESR